MNYVKARYIKDGKPKGRTYTFACEDETILTGDNVTFEDGKRGVIVDEEVDVDWLQVYGTENLKKAMKSEVVE